MDDLSAVVELLNTLGDNAMIAFIVYVIATFLSDLLIGTMFAGVIMYIARLIYKGVMVCEKNS